MFFLILHYKTAKVTNTITGEELGLDANRLALLYAQTPVETSLGTMTFAQFLVAAAEDDTLQEEYVDLTENYFAGIQEEALVTIDVITQEEGGEEKTTLLEPPLQIREAICVKVPLFLLSSSCNQVYSAASSVRIPLHDPNNYALIQVQTKIGS